MKHETQEFEAVGQHPASGTTDRRTSYLWAAIAILGALLVAAVAIVVAIRAPVGPDEDATERAVESTRTAQTTETQTVDQSTEPRTPAPTPSRAEESSDDDGDEDDSSDPAPPTPPAPTDPPEPETYMHPLEGTVWDVMVLSDGAGGMYDIHPSYPHQIEFDEGVVYSKGYVNGASAEYAISGNEHGWGSRFAAGPFTTTLMLGPAEAMTQEARINTALESAAYYEIFENTLFIRDDSADTLLILDIVPGG